MNKKTVLLLACPVMLLLMSLKMVFIPSQGKKPLTDSLKRPAKFGFGRPATAQEIAAWDIDVRPDGKGLPAGQGDVKKGRVLYAQKCAMCHGVDGTEKPGIKLPGNALVGDTSATSKPKTIGNYWPYATTLFDYMRRAMPYNLPGSLSNDEVYSITAYLLNANKIIKADVVLDAKNLYKVVMPAKKLFIMDDRKGGPEIK
ncbi:c-type cytochrome [Pedobacter roseus]|nr:cytochrome c [Pedobacter roseus]